MTLRHVFDNVPDGWLAFELSVLRRLKFASLANPFAGEPNADVYLKRWGVRVMTNDAAQWSWMRAMARVENDTEVLMVEDVEMVLEDAYVPRHRLYNNALRRWFNETDSWWFDNVRSVAERLGNEHKRALALNLGMMVGDYVLSFDDATLELRQPLSRVFRRLWEAEPHPLYNAKRNISTNREARDFIAAERADILFLRLPRPARQSARFMPWAWREEWVRGGDWFWSEFESASAGRLGARVETRQQYLHHVTELLEAAAHFPVWAIVHAETGFLSTDELAETVRRVRRVQTIYTKDFSELTGARAAIITAS